MRTSLQRIIVTSVTMSNTEGGRSSDARDSVVTHGEATGGQVFSTVSAKISGKESCVSGS